MMTRWCIFTIACGLALGAWAQESEIATNLDENVDPADIQTLTGFRVPDFDAEGRKRYELVGDYAEIYPKGLVKIKNLNMEFYKEGEVEMKVTAPRCIYDKTRGGAVSDSEVKIERKNMEVTGTGFIWDAKNEKLQIFKKTRVVLTGIRKNVTTGETSGENQ